MKQQLPEHHAADALDRVVHPEERDRAIAVVAQHSDELAHLRHEQPRELLWVRGVNGTDLVVVQRREAVGKWLRCLHHSPVATWHRDKMSAELADGPLQPGNR